jgi:hypothetical protein
VSATTRRDQIGYTCQFLRDDPGEARVLLSTIAEFFGVSKGSIEWQLNRYRATVMTNGRPKALPDEAYPYILEIVQARFVERKPVTYRLLQDALEWRFKISMRADTLRHICRGLPGVKSVVGFPMERDRVHCDQDAITAYYDELEGVIDGIPAEFVYNIDESGCSEWDDKPAEMIVLVPADLQDDRIYVPIDRHSKRSTMVGCISGDGGTMKSMVIVDRATMEDDLQLFGYDPRKVLMVSQTHAFMTTALFARWADEIFFPSIEESRSRSGYQGPALLLLDGCSSHHPIEFLEECERRNIYVIFLVPHSSDQTQPLDLVPFGIFKRYFNQSTFNALTSAQSNKVIRMMGAWYQATAPHQVIAAWLSAGLVPFRGADHVVYLRVDRSRARGVRGWGVDDPQIQPFGPAGQRRVRLPRAQ